ncbi:basic leucine zipper 34-like [Typha angustifolia]|uniref:basic leucine zipper 34-like n=1 Tax=Typha angustifolia TaxID=59011 RepID=UPI003C2C5C1F
MAQLPPKIPRPSPLSPMLTPSSQLQPSWVDEFLDFSAAKRGEQRSAVSGSVAFLEAPLADFDCLDADADKIMSMFSDDVPPSSSPSDHNSINDDDDKPTGDESEDALSACKVEPQDAPAQAFATVETIFDPKRVKRILANRQSAQRSRVRKLQYISELERSVTTLQTEVSVLSPRVAFLDHQRSVLSVGNSHLKQRIAALAQDKFFKDAHQEALKNEIERLRQVYHQQSLKNIADPIAHSQKELLS